MKSMKKMELMPVILAILKDEKFSYGGIFSKEEYYMKKYNLTTEQISGIQTCLYYALRIKESSGTKIYL